MENGTTNYPMPLKNFDTTLLSDDHFLLRGMVYLKENKPDMAQPLKEYLAWKKANMVHGDDDKSGEPNSDYVVDWKIGFQTDKANCLYDLAKHLVEKYHVKTISGRKDRDVFIYDNGVYRLGVNDLKAEIQTLLEELATTHIKNEVLEKIKDLTVCQREEFNVNQNFINLNNGILNIETGELTEHDPKYLFLHRLPIDYKANADCPAVKKFLFDILNEDNIPVIQEWIGYALYRSYFIKKAIIFVGERDTGKTTLINLLASLMGKGNVSGVSLQRITSDKFATAHLYNKHLNIFDDLSFKDINDNGGFKIAAGGGIITGEYKFGDQFQFENYSKLTFSCNKIPNVKDANDDAYFSRWIVIQFNKAVTNPDKFLINKLTNPFELSGLLNFALEGLNRLLINQEFSYKKNPDEIKAEMMRSGSAIANFAYDCLQEETGAWISKESMYNEFAKYARTNKQPVETIISLGQKLRKYADYIDDSRQQFIDPITGKKNQATGWRNVKFIKDNTNQDDNSSLPQAPKVEIAELF
ncbi:MAG: phage/plasmid primase, P4 family [Patescibacteria group bacterium]